MCFHMFRAHFALQMAAFSLELLIKNMTRWRARGRGISIIKLFVFFVRVLKVCAFICSVCTLCFRWRHFVLELLIKNMTRWRARGRGISIHKFVLCFAFYARVLKVCAFICSLRTLRFRWRHFVLELLIKNMTRSRARGRGISINKCVSFCWHFVFVY